MACPGLPADAFLGGILDYIDCQAQAIGSGGYQALAAPGSSLSLVLTGLLTLFVALFGYRMLFGQTPGVRDGVLAIIKVGIVLALALGWPAYRTLIYDVALKGPAELFGEIGAPAGLPGAGGGLVARLDNADRLLVTYTALGPGEALPRVPRPGEVVDSAGRPVRESTWSGFALDGSRILYLTGAIGALAAVRLVAGLMLALGPFFIAFLLFEGTRGLFEGWLRVLGAAALGALGTAVALGVELALLEPWLMNLIAVRTAGYATPGAPVELFVTGLVFALVLGAILFASARVAYGFRLPGAWRAATSQLVESMRSESLRVSALGAGAEPPLADRSRAVMISDAVAATQRRESGSPGFGLGGTDVAPMRHTAHPGPARDVPPPPLQPLGQTFRRTRTRHSASAQRRDRKS
jgi:type IV secretion system protein VirB6